MKKVTKEMDNEEVGEEEEVISTNSTMKIKITTHSKVVVMVNEEVKDMEPIKVPMKWGMKNIKLSVITVIKLDITLENIIVMLKQNLILLTTTKTKMSQHCYWNSQKKIKMIAVLCFFRMEQAIICVSTKTILWISKRWRKVIWPLKIPQRSKLKILISCKDGGHILLTMFNMYQNWKVIFLSLDQHFERGYDIQWKICIFDLEIQVIT